MADTLTARPTIVIVEDDEIQVRYLQAVLRKEFDEVAELVAFIDPAAAATYIEENWVDVVISDLDMPGLDGLELLGVAKRRNCWTQCLIMTGVSTSDSLVEACDLGAADYLLKPVDHRMLLDIVHQTLDRLSRWRLAFAGTLRRPRALDAAPAR